MHSYLKYCVWQWFDDTKVSPSNYVCYRDSWHKIRRKDIYWHEGFFFHFNATINFYLGDLSNMKRAMMHSNYHFWLSFLMERWTNNQLFKIDWKKETGHLQTFHFCSQLLLLYIWNNSKAKVLNLQWRKSIWKTLDIIESLWSFTTSIKSLFWALKSTRKINLDLAFLA